MGLGIRQRNYIKIFLVWRSDCVSDVQITGPQVLENGRQSFVDLTCSFYFMPSEYKQLDIKWYFDNQVTDDG